MADLLFHGKQGLDANPAQAFEHFQDLANAGDPQAMVNLAVLHIKVGKMAESGIEELKFDIYVCRVTFRMFNAL